MNTIIEAAYEGSLAVLIKDRLHPVPKGDGKGGLSCEASPRMSQVSSMHIVPSDALTDLFWSKVHLIASQRGRPLSSFDEAVAASILAAGRLALDDHHKSTRQLRVSPASTGSGKSTYAAAFVAALTEADPTATAAILCETIERCEETFRQLAELMDPQEIGLWTSEVPGWSRDATLRADARSVRTCRTVGDLRSHRVAIVTHALHRTRQGAATLTEDGAHRSLTIIDEKPEEVSIIAIEQGDVVKARDRATVLFGNGSVAETAIAGLNAYLAEVWQTESLTETAYMGLKRTISPWFASHEADEVLRSGDAALAPAIRFARCLVGGRAFMSRYHSRGRGGRFISYQSSFPLCPGMLLLDATSDLDGVGQIVGNRVNVACPQVSFENLHAIHVQTPPALLGETKRVAELVKDWTKADAYATWIKEVVIQHTEPGEKVLVVTHKVLRDRGHLPAAPSFADGQYFNLLGRKVAFTHWGTGIGSNQWREARTVCLFDEFHLPKAATVATLLGLKEEAATTGTLRPYQSPGSRDPALVSLSDGHRLRWTKQLAMRGNARNLTSEGRCGAQKLVLAMHLDRLLTHWDQLFAGARLEVDPASVQGLKGASAVAAYLAATTDDIVTTEDLKRATGVDFGKHRSRLLASTALSSVMTSYGWTLIDGGGRGRQSRFERTTIMTALPTDTVAATVAA